MAEGEVKLAGAAVILWGWAVHPIRPFLALWLWILGGALLFA